MFQEIAIEAARAAGKIQRERFGTNLAVDQLSAHDVKLEVDRLCEEAILTVIRKRFPAHSVLSEELGIEKTSSEYTWVIDPLDGTANYFRSIPHFCTSVALLRGNEQLTGVIYDPMREEMFVAEKGKGTQLNGKPVSVSKVNRIKDAFILFGFMKSRETIERNLVNFNKLIFEARKIRMSGSAALDLAYVAAGRFDIYIESGIKSWDFAAGSLLVTEAGGEIESKQDDELTYDVLGTNGLLTVEVANFT